MKTVKAFMYSRISTLQQQQGFGISRQISTVTDFLQYAVIDPRLGYQLDPNNYEILESDIGKSAFKGINWGAKSSLGKFYQAVLEQRITSGVLIVENVDRLTRLSNYEASNRLSTLITNGIDILEVESGMCFSNKIPESSTVLNMSISRAYNESLRKSHFSKSSWKERKKQSKENAIALNNNTPDWLSLSEDKKAYVIDADKVQVITKIFDMYSKGVGVTDIVKSLNTAGDRYNGKGWNTTNVYHKLRDRRLNGYLIGRIKTISKKDNESNDEIEKRVLENRKAKEEAKNNAIRIYPIVIQDLLFTKVQTIMDKNVLGRKPKSTTSKQRNLFNGIIKCLLCGSPMIVQSMSNGGQYLRCYRQRTKDEKCQSKMLRYIDSESLLLEHIKGLNLDAIYGQEGEESSLEALERKLSGINSKIDALNEQMAKASDEEEMFLLMNFKRKRLAERVEVTENINTIQAASSVVKMEYAYDIAEICNQDNTTLRRKTNLHLSNVISSIKCHRSDTGTDVIYTYDISYHRDIVKHVLITDSKCNLLAQITIHKKDNVMVYETPSFKLEVTEEVLTLDVPQAVNSTDYLLLLNYVDSIKGSEKVADWMRDNLNHLKQ